jgi:putative intracellular protease/amidase
MSTPRKLGAILFEGFGPLEMFGALGPDLEISTVAETPGPLASSAGPATVADYGFDDAPDFDLYLVPGGMGVLAQQDNPAMLDYLRKVAPTAERFMSVCNGAALPASAGVLDGRRATALVHRSGRGFGSPFL